MNMMDRIIEIARQVRDRCEDVANKTNWFGADLSCMCGVASYALRRALRKEGIPAELICGEYTDHAGQLNGDYHCWVSVGNCIIDITATQFGNPHKIYVVAINNYHYIKKKVVKNPSAFFKQWPPDQRPHKELLKKILT
jgi:hypothetical protein